MAYGWISYSYVASTATPMQTKEKVLLERRYVANLTWGLYLPIIHQELQANHKLVHTGEENMPSVE